MKDYLNSLTNILDELEITPIVSALAECFYGLLKFVDLSMFINPGVKVQSNNKAEMGMVRQS